MIRIEWDSRPVRQQFGACNIVCDGVAILPDGRRFRVNASATRGARKPDCDLRYMTDAKRGAIVPESAMADVRAAALASFAELLKPLRAEVVAAAEARDASPAVDVIEPAKPEAVTGAALVANTTRACYWRTVSGHFVATRADDPRPVADAPGYRSLESIMRLKGEPSDVIARLAPPAMLAACSPYAQATAALPPYRIAAELDRLQRIIASLRNGKGA